MTARLKLTSMGEKAIYKEETGRDRLIIQVNRSNDITEGIVCQESQATLELILVILLVPCQ